MTRSINVTTEIGIEEWRPDSGAAVEGEIEMLAEVLRSVVQDGASVSFFMPFPRDEARSFWSDKVLPQVRAGRTRVLLARLEERIVGTVQLELEMPPNQQHRAAVAKLLVHPEARRRGIARTLMLALEEIARREGRTLLTLDTVTGSAAELLYRSLGYVVVGVIPAYARGALTPALESTTIMYKQFNPTVGSQTGAG